MGLIWALGWALGGLMIGVASKLTPFLPWHYFFDVFDAPMPAMAMPGFIGGAIFSVVLGIAGRGRRFADLSLPRFVAWGAVGGLLLSLVPAAMVAVGLASAEGSRFTIWQSTAMFSGPIVLFSAASAFATLKLARMAAKQESPDPVS